MLHLRFEGRSYDLNESQLNISTDTNDAQIKQRLAQYLDLRADRLDNYVIDRPKTGNIIIRPEAVYG
ncbi:MAG: hypothetical protein ACFBSE_27320 [Prochloraceae cyanobacterium]